MCDARSANVSRMHPEKHLEAVWHGSRQLRLLLQFHCSFTVARAGFLSPSISLSQTVTASGFTGEAGNFGSRSSTCVSESEGDEREKQISCTVLAQCFCKLVSEGARAG